MKFASRVGTTFVACLFGLAAAPAAFAQGFFPEPANQRGLSGTWADPVRPGQKIFIDIAAGDSGKGRLFGGWLSFDSSGNGTPDAQRWYTFQGEVSDAQADTQVTLYRSSQGRFDAPSQTKTEAIGTAILHFEDCYSGSLRYTIKAPGSSDEHEGAFALHRASPEMACRSPFGAVSADAPAAALSGTWYQPATSGQGLLVSVDQRGGTLSAGWFTYAGDAATTSGQRWFTLQAPLVADVAHLSDIPIHATTGGKFDAGGFVASTRVGTAQVTFSGCNQVRLDYRFDAGENAGLQGGIDLVRLLAQPCAASALTLAVSVNTPPGIDAAELVVVGADRETPVSADGNATLPRASGAPALVSAVHSSGKVALMGMADPFAPDLRLNAHSSTVSLLFFALGGTQLPEQSRHTLIELIDKEAATAGLESIVSARLAADPFALDDLDDALASAVLSAAQAMHNHGVASALAAPRVFAKTASIKASGASATGDGNIQPLLLITPSDAPNGIGVVQNDNASSFRIRNDKRRPALAKLYETAYRLAGGSGQIDVSPPQMIGDATNVPSTQSLSVFSAIGDVFKGTSPWSPVQTGPVPVQQHAKADKTRFDLVVLAPVWDAPTPAFFADPKYANESGQWRKDLRSMYAQTSFSLVFGAMLEALGAGGGAISEARFASVIAGAEASKDAAVAGLWAQAASGVSLVQVSRFMLYQLTGALDPAALTAQTAAQREMMVGLVSEVNPELSGQIAAGKLSSARFAQIRAAVRVAIAVSLVAGVADTGAQWKDLHTGDSGNIFSLTLWQPDVKISPDTAKIAPGDTQGFSARVPGNDARDFSYRWSLDGDNLAILSDRQGNNARSFSSPSANVDLVTTPSSQGTYRVTVEVFGLVEDARQSLGRATATVTLDGVMVSLSPASVLIERQNGTATFNVGFQPAQDASNFEYEWTAASQAGALTCAGNTTSPAQQTVTCNSGMAVYNGKSDNLGGEIEDVLVSAYRRIVDELGNVQRVKLGSAKSYVQVKQMFTIRLTPDEGEVLPNGNLPLHAAFVETLPPGSTVTWHWSLSGDGALQVTPSTGNASDAVYHAGEQEGDAYASVYAFVDVGGTSLHNLYILPQTNHVKITRHPSTQTLHSGYEFPTDSLAGCGGYPSLICFSAAAITRVPKVSGAQNYRLSCVTNFYSGPQPPPYPAALDPNQAYNPWPGVLFVAGTGGHASSTPLSAWDNGGEYIVVFGVAGHSLGPLEDRNPDTVFAGLLGFLKPHYEGYECTITVTF